MALAKSLFLYASLPALLKTSAFSTTKMMLLSMSHNAQLNQIKILLL